MKKLLLLKTVLLLSVLFISSSYGQSADLRQKAYQHIEAKYGITQTSIGDLRIKSQYQTEHNQVSHVYFVQTYRDVDILGSGINMAIQKNGIVSSVSHNLKMLNKFPVTFKQAKVPAGEAITLAARSLGQDTRSVPSLKSIKENGLQVFDKGNISLQDIPVTLGYLQMPDGQYRLVYTMNIESANHNTLYQSYVDAVNGEVIANDALTLRCHFDDGYLSHSDACDDDTQSLIPAAPSATGAFGQYRVLPLSIESPNHGNFQLLTGIDDLNASPLGWHDSDGVTGADHTDTRGNNVHAFLDRNWDYFPDLRVEGGNNLIFDFPYNDNAEPIVNQNVAVTNLFFWNNLMHDFSYQYGFDEGAGNFQEFNYSGDGAGGDYVEAQAQFGDNNHVQCGIETGDTTGCVNNSFFSSPRDGFGGRMVMYTWDRDNGSKFLDVIQPAELSGKIVTGLPEFGPDITTEAITGEVVEINDGSFDPTKGCAPVTDQPELAGKIALIDRGICDFSLKVFNAQEAGAIAAIVCNFEDATIPMGAGENATEVTIPSVFISSVEATRLRTAIDNGLVVSLVSPGTGGPTLRDGCLDNSVIAHEYGHGISTRLTGGPDNSGCLSPNGIIGLAEESHGLGEGWSDFFALVTTVQPGDNGAKRRGIGTYASKEPTNGRGIRTYPYSTDMSINPHTYDNILLEAVPHGVGSVWCAMIWDMYWALTDAYGWDPDLYHGTGGNNTAIQLVMDGLKMQPCNPGFIDARDAILQADMINNGGANQCLIWNVFARRGLGVNAEGGDPDSRSDGKEGFEVPTACLDVVTFTKTMTPEVVAGDNIQVTLKVNNYKDFQLTNVLIEDPVPNGCSYIPGSGSIEPTNGNTLVWSINSIDPDQELVITYLLKTDQARHSLRMYYDDIEGIADERWDVTFDPSGTSVNLWTQQDTLFRSGTSAWRVGDVVLESQHFLENYEPYDVTGNYPVYRFYTYYNTETGVDGGFLEISTEENPAWKILNSEIFRGSYPRKLQYGTFAIPNLGAYSGRNSLTNQMDAVYIDLRDYIGQKVKIRYRFGTDTNTAVDGWYVDDVELMDAVLYNSEACITSDQTGPVCAEAPSRGTIVDTEITFATKDDPSSAAFDLMPNPADDLVQVVMSADKSDQAIVRVYNLTGHLLSSSPWSLASGINQKTLDISHYPSGMYVLQVKTTEGMRSEKFVKE